MRKYCFEVVKPDTCAMAPIQTRDHQRVRRRALWPPGARAGNRISVRTQRRQHQHSDQGLGHRDRRLDRHKSSCSSSGTTRIGAKIRRRKRKPSRCAPSRRRRKRRTAARRRASHCRRAGWSRRPKTWTTIIGRREFRLLDGRMTDRVVVADLVPNKKTRLRNSFACWAPTGSERRNAWTALERTMQSEGIGWSDIGNVIEHGAELRRRQIYRGRNAGVRASHARRGGRSGNQDRPGARRQWQRQWSSHAAETRRDGGVLPRAARAAQGRQAARFRQRHAT